MTMALCTGCGATKPGTWLTCRTCGTASTGQRDLDVFLSDHYLNPEALSFLRTAISRIRCVTSKPDDVQKVFLFYAASTFPGLIQIEMDKGLRSDLEGMLRAAAVPPPPEGMSFEFHVPRVKRRRKWWRFW